MASLRISLCATILAHVVPLFAAKIASRCPASSVTPLVLTLANSTLPSQDAFTYGIKVNVGNPKQTVCLTPSTVVDNTLLVSKDVCADESRNMSRAQCRSYHGGMFDVAAAGSSFHNVSVIELSADPAWTLFNDAYHVAGETDLGLISNLAISNMTVAVITTGINFTAGHMGLGNHSGLLSRLKDAQLIPSLGFGLNAGSQSTDNPRDGNLVLGDYDSASSKSTFYTYPMNYPEMLAGRPCPLQVQIQGLQLLLKGREPIPLLDAGDGHRACLEPYDNLFRLSRIGLERFKDVTGWTTGSTYDPGQLYVPEPGLMYPSITGFNGSLKFILDNGYSVEIPNSELQHPLRALDKTGALLTLADPVLQSNVTQVNVYADPLEAWVLGKVFLSQVYITVDYEAQQFQLADVKQNEVTPILVRFPSAAAGCEGSTQLAGGSIAAIVLGALVGLALMGGLGYCLYRNRNRQYLPKAEDTGMQNNNAFVPDPRQSITDTSTISGHPLQRCELSGDRRTLELSCPNNGYPPPSPRAPPLQIPSSSRNLPIPYENVSPEIPQPQRATQPWNA